MCRILSLSLLFEFQKVPINEIYNIMLLLYYTYRIQKSAKSEVRCNNSDNESSTI